MQCDGCGHGYVVARLAPSSLQSLSLSGQSLRSLLDPLPPPPVSFDFSSTSPSFSCPSSSTSFQHPWHCTKILPTISYTFCTLILEARPPTDRIALNKHSSHENWRKGLLAEDLKCQRVDLWSAHCLTPPLKSSFLHAFLMTTATQYYISGGSLGHTSTPAPPLANSLDEGRHVNLSARLEHVCLLTPNSSSKCQGQWSWHYYY